MPSSKRVGVIGSTGQLGTDLLEVLSAAPWCEVTPITHDQLEVADPEQAMSVLGGGRFDAVINCAAFHRVDDCEEQVDEAFRINARGALAVARACAAGNALCVFISTDYVFGGDRGRYNEEDRTVPVNVYGASKVAGELLVQQACPRALLVRISSVFGKAGARGKGGNFIEAILKKAAAGGPVQVVNDSWMSPTYTMDAAETIAELIQADATGLFHASNAGRCSWWEFASEAVRRVGLDVPVEPTSSDAYPSKARRPRDASLEGTRLPAVLGHGTRPWQEALGAYLLEKGHIPAVGSGYPR